jgi:serpin B
MASADDTFSLKLNLTPMKRFNLLLSALLVVFAFASCHKGTTVQPSKGKDLTLSTAELQQASANNTFSFNLFRSVAAQSPSGNNLFMSPLSVSIALGMTTNGANGATLDSMRNTLRLYGFTQDQVNTYYNTLITELPELDPNTTLKLANSVWYNQNYSILPAFLQTENTSYLAKVQGLDFGASASLSTINNWISQQTGGKITNAMSKLNVQDVMYLVNAIYFKSIWADKFDPSQTTKMGFTLGNNSQVQTNFMRKTGTYKMYNDPDATVLEMPYSNNKYSMVIVMPGAGKAVNEVVAGTDSAKWQTWMNGLSPTTVQLSMPKFQFTYGAELKNNLSAMGMGVAFSNGADFSKISPGGQLFISSAAHKAYIAVDENGTTAAAVTIITITPTDVLENQVIIDHPFMFAIREMKTGLILFTGIVNNPTQNGQ